MTYFKLKVFYGRDSSKYYVKFGVPEIRDPHFKSAEFPVIDTVRDSIRGRSLQTILKKLFMDRLPEESLRPSIRAKHILEIYPITKKEANLFQKLARLTDDSLWTWKAWKEIAPLSKEEIEERIILMYITRVWNE